jgi:hypothetical protein
MCRALYAPMQVLCLADQKSAAMDKLNYYVLQTDQMLVMHCEDAEEHGAGLPTPFTMKAMECSTSAGSSDDLGSDHEENDGVESVDKEDKDDNGIISAQADNQNGVDDNISDDGDEQQVPMLLYIAFILCIVQFSNTHSILLF